MTDWHPFLPDDYLIDINGDSSASFSPCRQYRQVLERKIGNGDDAILWLGMNPSTADAFKNDPTVAREIVWSQRWGYSRYIKMNVCDYRSTQPKGMLEAPGGPVSDANMPIMLQIAASAKTIVVCHGVLPKSLQNIAELTTDMLIASGHPLKCMGTTKAGFPKHPLYLPGATELQDYSGLTPA